jgi:hypothetical protein
VDEVDRLRAENQRLQAKVRRLRKRAGRDDLGFLFVMTYGRSGSTLVAGLLNGLPGYLIRGENRNAVHHLFRYHQTLLAESGRGRKRALRKETHPFFGIGDFPAPRSLAGIRRLVLETVLRPGADTRVTGFKEIRWYHEDMEEYVAWLREVFPGARFLVNTRAHADVLSSKWWAKGDPQHNAEHLAAIERRILATADDLGEAAYRIHYDDYVADPTVLRGVFEWLGEPWDEGLVRSVMSVTHSTRS